MSIQKAYDLWSEIYDENDNVTRDLDASATETVLSKYQFGQVLELGCGTGKNTQWLLNQGAEITGLDFSEGMLSTAMSKFRGLPFTGHIADLTQEWPTFDNKFDLITSSLVLEHIEDLSFIFAQASLNLQTSGHFFISELHPIKQYLGSKARFESNGQTVELKVFVHHLTDYIKAAHQSGFILTEIREWFDDEEGTPPRLLSFVFTKDK